MAALDLLDVCTGIEVSDFANLAGFEANLRNTSSGFFWKGNWGLDVGAIVGFEQCSSGSKSVLSRIPPWKIPQSTACSSRTVTDAINWLNLMFR